MLGGELFVQVSIYSELKSALAPARSLLTNLVEPQEVAKMYALLNLLTQLSSLIAIPTYRSIFLLYLLSGEYYLEFLFRLIFGATLETFPGAFLNLTAGLMMASGYAYFYLFTQRRTIINAMKEQDSESAMKEEEIDDKSQAP